MRISTARKSVVGERPLNAGERGALVLAAVGVTLLAYLTTIVASAVLLVVSAVMLVVTIGAARVGIASAVSPILQRIWGLVVIIVRSQWLRRDVEYRLPLTSADAPRLFAMLSRVADKLEVRAPREVAIEMTCGAWVELKGFRRGSADTRLGIGYDLLAGLPEHEVEAVIAHEMAHAKLVNRALSSWSKKALSRLATMTGTLEAYTASQRENQNRTQLGEWLYKICDALTMRVFRLVATYSRQDEFEADAGAADLCGPASIRWALIHLERLSADLERLPWKERVARIESEQSFSRWLVGALAHESVKPRDQMRDAVDPYSTHPSLRDRIAAIGANQSVAIPGRPGIELLGDPDRVATQLSLEIQRVALREERADSKRLRKQIKKYRRPSTVGSQQWLAAGMLVLGPLAIIASLDPLDVTPLAGGLIMVGFGLTMILSARFRDRRVLAIPSYGSLSGTTLTPEEMTAREDTLENDLRRAHESVGRKPDVEGYVDTCFAALNERDFLRAHVAARLALSHSAKHKEAALGFGIAAAGLGNREQSGEMLEWLRTNAGWRTPNAMWGVVWSKCLLDEWPVCEGLAAELVERNPDQPTFHAVLALARLGRGKLRSAEPHARKAMTLEPSNTRHVALLGNIYIESGRLRDAVATLSRVRDVATTEVQMAQLFVHLELLRHNADEAAKWCDVVSGLDSDPAWLIRFGFMFESARFDDHAASLFSRALEAGHFPEAHIGLARLRAAAGSRDIARQHLFDALNAERDRAASAQSPITLFHDIVGLLNSLEERHVQCKGWIAPIPNTQAGALAGHSVFVCAPNRDAAVDHLQRVVTALYPSQAFAAAQLAWREAPAEQQPIRPVPPGVQRVITQ